MAKLLAKTYPHDFFLVKGSDGNVHWFLKDPMNNSSMDNETNIAEEIFSFVGTGDIANPVMVRFQCGRIERCWPFKVDWLDKIRRGGEGKHIQDYTGAQIDIINAVNQSDYPLNGVVLGPDGTVTEVRTYNEDGFCSDGIGEHTLVVLQANDPEE